MSREDISWREWGEGSAYLIIFKIKLYPGVDSFKWKSTAKSCQNFWTMASADTVYKRGHRKRKTPKKFEVTEKLRVRPKHLNHKPNRRRCVKKKQKKTEKRPQSIQSFFSPHTVAKKSKEKKPKAQSNKVQRRLRSTAPIDKLIDEIWQNHKPFLKEVNASTYACKCGASFLTSSYRRANFEAHLKRDVARAAKNPWSIAIKAKNNVPCLSRSAPVNPKIVCQGLYLREIEGVNITDRYNISVDGRDGFYGVANHRSYVERELRGTYKSNLCLITGSFCQKMHILYP